jgi:hypothetical protein
MWLCNWFSVLMKRKDITEQEGWVVVATPTFKHPTILKHLTKHLHSPIKGHVMTEQYFEYHYEKRTSYEYEP